MPKTLCLDFGNTRLKWAVFSEEKILETGVLSEDGTVDLKNLLEKFKPEKSILSSVVNHAAPIEEMLKQETAFHLLNHHSRIPVSTPVGKPETIGADRLALVVAAAKAFPEKNNLVIGLGSAITYNNVNRLHQFLGGGISPGLEMRFRSLNQFTAKLPLVKPHWNFSLVGHDTRTNILSGVILGMAKEIDGIVEAYRDKYENLNVLMTGGDATHIRPLLRQHIIEDADLLFRGLFYISEFNLTT